MRVVFDIEANSLTKPTQIWVIVCKDIDTDEYHIFREITKNEEEKQRFLDFSKSVSLWIGHNILGYDFIVLDNLLNTSFSVAVDSCIDTLICSKLIDYSRRLGHSIEAYGEEFGLEKIKFNDWTKYSQEMETYCVRDVDICHKVYLKYLRYLSNPDHIPSINLEHRFQQIVNDLHDNGFSFDSKHATSLLDIVQKELDKLDAQIKQEFQPKLKLVREVTPRITKHGTLNRADFRFEKTGDLSDYNGGPFCRCEWVEFNPSSHKQIVDTLHVAGWQPIEKTQTYINTEREISRLKYKKNKEPGVDKILQELYTKLETLRKYGWKITENNLATLPDNAPSSAHILAKRILLESRRRTLTEWLGLVHPDTQRIHGKFYGIGAWTHRMAHQQPNTANIPTEAKLYGHEMRALWRAPKNRLLVGVDAESIQLRIFAHYINDSEFTEALVRGKKHDKTDPHSVNQRVLGSICKSRQIAKRFIYALLLGAGIQKLAEILGCSTPEAQEALDRLMARYTGFAHLKQTVIPADAKRGYFIGLDGRKVQIPGDTIGTRKHLCMSGYLQNGEAIIMKKSCILWHDMLKDIADQFKLVNFVHDEWQTEVTNNIELALRVAQTQAESLRIVGEKLKLNCPLAGSYWNEDLNDYTIGTNWSYTH